ncbi:MBL fold metallo-hydrolase [Pseudoalteromonas sp. SCSIO 43210]
MYYLKEQVYFEPLFNNWYAWPYLLPPVQGARHLVHTHTRIMKSFVNNAHLHIMANQEPGMSGSDFLACSEDQIEDIRALIEFSKNECSDLVALSAAVSELDELIRAHKTGESIEYLYEQLPDALKGYIELFFDMEHNPSYRLLEGLLYKSDYYKPQLQTVAFGLVSDTNQRPFVFSTPRLVDDAHIHIDLNFTSPILDRISKARQHPLSAQELDELFAQCKCRGGLTKEDLFTTESPKNQYKPVTDGIRLEYTGHAGFLIETKDISILIDPVIASVHESYIGDVFSFNQLPDKIDYICLTHSHQDHVNLETLLQLRHKTDTLIVPKNNGGMLADPSLKLMLQQLNFKVMEVEDMEEIALPGGKIIALPFLGEHGDLNIRSKAAWFIELYGKKFFLGADSANLDPNMYRHIQKAVGDVDILAIGMECVGAPYTWMYGALHTKKVSKQIKNSRRLNGCDSKLGFGMVEIFKPKEVYIYALGLEPWFNYFMGLDYNDDSEQIIQSNKMLQLCHDTDIKCEKMFGRKTINL